MTRRAVIHSDGASSGNPGQAGIGGVVRLHDRTYEFSRCIGITTNNVAEYSALIEALRKAHELGAGEVEVYLDSELVVRQVNGLYKVKHENMIPLFEQAMGLLRSFKKYSVTHVGREENRRADQLSKEAIKKKTP
jgi:ribonuclease HI